MGWSDPVTLASHWLMSFVSQVSPSRRTAAWLASVFFLFWPRRDAGDTCDRRLDPSSVMPAKIAMLIIQLASARRSRRGQLRAAQATVQSGKAP